MYTLIFFTLQWWKISFFFPLNSPNHIFYYFRKKTKTLFGSIWEKRKNTGDFKDAFDQNISFLASLIQLISPRLERRGAQDGGVEMGLPHWCRSVSETLQLETEGGGQIPECSNHTQSRSAGHMMDLSQELTETRGLFLFDYSSWQIDNCKGIQTWCFATPPPPTFALTLPLVRRVRHLVFVRWLRCIILMIAGEHLSAFARLERRLWATKWPHPVYIFIIARLTYLLTSGKNLQVNLLGSFSKE